MSDRPRVGLPSDEGSELDSEPSPSPKESSPVRRVRDRLSADLFSPLPDGDGRSGRVPPGVPQTDSSGKASTSAGTPASPATAQPPQPSSHPTAPAAKAAAEGAAPTERVEPSTPETTEATGLRDPTEPVAGKADRFPFRSKSKDDDTPLAEDEPAATPPKLKRTDRRSRSAANRARGGLRARRVHRIVRRVDPWSVLKFSLMFFFCLWLMVLIAAVLLWGVAVGSGTVENVENFIANLLAFEEFHFNGGQIFRLFAMGGLIMVFTGTAFTAILSVLFNLISDLVGGIRMTVVEEESIRRILDEP